MGVQVGTFFGSTRGSGTKTLHAILALVTRDTLNPKTASFMGAAVARNCGPYYKARVHQQLLKDAIVLQQLRNTWTPKVCRRMVFWAIFRGFGPLFYLLWGFRYAPQVEARPNKQCETEPPEIKPLMNHVRVEQGRQPTYRIRPVTCRL